MSRRTLINIALLVVVAGLAAFIAIEQKREVRVELEPLSRENPRAISRIRLEPVSDGPIELQRAEGAWNLVAPIRGAANDFRVNALVGVLAAPVHARIDASAQELDRFGLAPPKGRLLLDGVEVLFGDTEPIHGRRYLLYEGRVALVDDAYFSHLSSSAANYVHPSLLGRDPTPSAIRLPNMRVYREGDDWRLDTTDAELKASDADITRLVDTWRNAQATAVRPYEKSLDWKDSIHVTLADAELHFDLARTEYEVIFGRRDPGIQYHLTKASAARLLDLKPADSDS